MISCFPDAEGVLRVYSNDLHPLIKSYLEQDVQNGINSINFDLEMVDEVEQGKREEWSCTGNAHTLTITPQEVVIENLWSDSFGIAHLTLKDFRQSLEIWRQAVLESPIS